MREGEGRGQREVGQSCVLRTQLGYVIFCRILCLCAMCTFYGPLTVSCQLLCLPSLFFLSFFLFYCYFYLSIHAAHGLVAAMLVFRRCTFIYANARV